MRTRHPAGSVVVLLLLVLAISPGMCACLPPYLAKHAPPSSSRCHSNSDVARRSFLCMPRWEFALPYLSPFEGIPPVLQICCLSSRSGICCSTTPLMPTKLVRQSVTLLLHRPQRQPQVGPLQLQDLGSRCLKDLAVTLARVRYTRRRLYRQC